MTLHLVIRGESMFCHFYEVNSGLSEPIQCYVNFSLIVSAADGDKLLCVVKRWQIFLRNVLKPGQPPFSHVGIDYFGPFMVKQGRSQVKRYGCIFMCLTITAVHIEIAHSLDTDSFINALRRFIARRGKPVLVRTDNGTNFVSGEKELRTCVQKWNRQRIHEYLLQQEVRRIFNSPAASHHGGIWERCIRTTRKILNALLNEQALNDEGLLTLMCEVEAVINGRPITNVSENSRDLEALSPNHLLLLRQGAVLPPGLF